MNYAFLAVSLLMFFPSAYDALFLLQQNGYTAIKNKKFWLRYLLYAITVAVATVIAFLFGTVASAVCYGAAAFLSFLMFAERFMRARGRLKLTNRAKRLIALSFAFYAVPIVVTFVCAPAAALVASFALAVPSALLGAFAANPFERRNNRRYERMLKEKLAASPKLIRIGITGSAGKTSVKNYLYAMLSTRFRVLKTDKNYNTPLGLWLTVKDENLDCYDVFIAEMGARKKGDIKDLTEIVRPDAGIITTVLPQHLETFHTLEAVKEEKSELAKGIVSGIVVLNTDDKNVAAMEDDTISEVVKVGKRGDYSVECLTANWRGTSFYLKTPIGSIPFKTEILGKHNAENIALAAALALRLGISKEDVQFAVESLKPVPHRLEFTSTAGGVYVLDDGYNSNPRGAECALEILSTYPGRRVVFSQGLVELGKKEREENTALGAKIAEVADVLILTGRLGEYIYEGAEGKDLEIKRVKDVKEGRELLKTLLETGDLLYLQNDLPELYR